MRMLTIVVLAVSLILLGVSIQATLKSNTAVANALLPPPGRTSAPGDGGTCVTCHRGNVGIADGGIIIVPQHSLTEYVPGATDTVAVIIGDSGQARWGFELTALKNSDNSMAGSLGNVPDFQVYTDVQSSGGKMYVSHTSNGATSAFDPTDGTFWGVPNGAGWIFEWTAPPPGSGPVTLYVAGVAADSSQTANATDYTYANTIVLQEAGTTPVTNTTWGKIKKRYR